MKINNRKLIIVVTVFLVGFFAARLTHADMITPTATHVYFEKDGQPYNKPVTFTVKCYGYNQPIGSGTKDPGTYIPENVFSFSANCPSYGCKIYEPYYLNYRHIDYCDLEGQIEEGSFELPAFSNSPRMNCKNIAPIENNGKFYKNTERYQNCLREADKNYSQCQPEQPTEEDQQAALKLRENCTNEMNNTILQCNGKGYEEGQKCFKNAKDNEIKCETSIPLAWNEKPKSCSNQVQAAYQQCKQYLTEETTNQVPDVDSSGNPIYINCELKFQIPKSLGSIHPSSPKSNNVAVIFLNKLLDVPRYIYRIISDLFTAKP